MLTYFAASVKIELYVNDISNYIFRFARKKQTDITKEANMKKRLTYALFALMLIFAVAFSFAACGEEPEEHKHAYSQEWESDDTHHWHKAICEHTDEVSSKEEHTFDEGEVTVEATTTEAGELTKTCTVCGKTDTEVIPPLSDEAHTHEFSDEEIAPTCAEKGYTEYTCECGVSYKDNYVDKTEHEVAEWESNGDGTHSGVCTLGHTVTVSCNFRSSATAPLCDTQGYTTYVCSVCDYEYKDDYVSATGHHYLSEFASNDSYHWHTADCGHTEEKSEYEQHEYTTEVTAPTCTERGYTTYTCRCGYTYDADYVDALGHSVSEWTLADSTLLDDEKCEYVDTFTGVCSTCSQLSTKTETVEKHSYYWAIISPATCVSEGEKAYICANENCKYHTVTATTEKQNYSDGASHVWEIDEEHSNSSVTAYVCSDCSETKRTVLATDNNVSVSDSDFNDVNEIELPEATIGFDSEAKSNLSGDGNVSVSAGTLNNQEREKAINNANLTEEQKASLNGKEIYSFTVSTDTNSNINQLGGDATIRIPYTLKSGETPEDLVIWYISGNELEKIDATYSEDSEGNGYVTFTTDHFSDYVISELTPQERCERDGHETVTFAATCREGGYTVCTRCGAVTEVLVPLGHNWHSSVTAEASCAANGQMTLSCLICRESYTQIIPATGHYYVLCDHTAATCVEAGESVYGCAYCDDEYSVSIPAKEHTFIVSVVAPTCTELGYTEKTCTACGTTLNVNYVQPLGHKYSTQWNAAEEGHYHVCSVCAERGDLYVHTPGAEATETSAQICTVCEYIITPPLAHTHTLTKVDAVTPGCLDGGNIEYYTCSCGKWFKDAAAEELIVDHTSVFLSAKGHTLKNVSAKDPTCTESGYTSGVQCSVCKKFLRGHVEISELGHQYAAKVTAPTCEGGGYTVYTCSCGDTYTDDETEALGHKYVSAVTAPTCLEGGHTTHTCSRCSCTYEDGFTSALGHSYAKAWSTDEGEHWHECTVCGDKTDKAVHNPDYTEATEAHGIKCTVCDYQIAKALEHTHIPAKTVPAKEATCTASGSLAYYVCACGERFYDEECTESIESLIDIVIKPSGHTMVKAPGKEATCTEKGYSVYSCECGYSYYGDYVDALGHSVGKDWQSGDGEHWHECTVCGEKTDKAAHEYEDGKCVCGAEKPINPDEAVYVYEQVYEDTESNERFVDRYEFLADGTVKYVYYVYSADGSVFESEPEYANWDIRGRYVICLLEGKPIGTFIAEEDGYTLLMVDGSGKPVEYHTFFAVDMSPYYVECAFVFYEGGKAKMEQTVFTSDGEEFAYMSMGGKWIISSGYLVFTSENSSPIPFSINAETGVLTVMNPTTNPSECKHENVIIADRIEATCARPETEIHYCIDCSTSETVKGECSTEHNFVGDYCYGCGKAKDGEEIGTVLYFGILENEDESGLEIALYFYDNGIARAVYFYHNEKLSMSEDDEDWYEEDGLIFAGELVLEIENDGFTVTVVGGGEGGENDCNHENKHIIVKQEATCYHSGSIEYRCIDCGSYEYEELPLLEHQFDENGICGACNAKNLPHCKHEREVERFISGNKCEWAKYEIICEDCGVIVEETEMFGGGHEYDEEIRACIKCGRINPDFCEHRYVLVSANGNCAMALNLIYKCELCGAEDCKTAEQGSHNIGEDGFCTVCHTCEKFDCMHTSVIVNTKTPTCTEMGRVEYICEDCVSVMTEMLGFAEHQYDSDNVCESCGKLNPEYCSHENVDCEYYGNVCDGIRMEGLCLDCGYEIKEYIEGVGHQYDENDYCPNCERYNPESCEHDYSKILYSYGDCKLAICCDVECVRCGAQKSTYILQGEHSYNEDGECVKCGAYDNEDYCKHEKVVNTILKNPGCESHGVGLVCCDECRTAVEYLIEPSGHSFDENGVCSNCGFSHSGEETLEVFYEAYIGESRVVFYTNSSCERIWNEYIDGKVIERKEEGNWWLSGGYIYAEIAGKIHTFEYGATEECKHENRQEQNIIAPSCTYEGYVEYYCPDCDRYFNESLGFAAHEYGEDGTCANCGFGDITVIQCYHKSREEIGRNEPTCTVEESVEYYCPDCDSYFTEYFGFGGHQYGEDGSCVHCGDIQPGEIEREAFYEAYIGESRVVFYTDNSCERIWYESIDGKVIERKEEGKWWLSDGYIYAEIAGEIHTFEYGATEECKHESFYSDGIGATCTESGLLREICNDCGEIISEIYIEAPGHNYVDGVCANCGESETTEAETYVICETAIDGYRIICYSDETCIREGKSVSSDGMATSVRDKGFWSYNGEGSILLTFGENTYTVNI